MHIFVNLIGVTVPIFYNTVLLMAGHTNSHYLYLRTSGNTPRPVVSFEETEY